MNYSLPIQKALIYIDENLNNKITLESLAKKSGYSEFHFHRLFLSVIGETVMEYIRRKRILSSTRDLLNTDANITYIALKYSFESHDVFARAFKRILGVTPSQYRKINYHSLSINENNPKEAIQMFNYSLNQKMVCSTDERRKCLPNIELILELSEKAIKNGLLSLESYAKDQTFFFRKTLNLVLEGVEPQYIHSIMKNYIITGDYKGVDLLQRIIILEGLLAIQSGENPMLLSERLLSFLGEELSQEVESSILQKYNLQDQIIEDFYNTALNLEPVSKSTTKLDDPISKLDTRSLQRIMRDVPIEITVTALKGASGNTIVKVLDCVPHKIKAAIINELNTEKHIEPQSVIDAQSKIIEIILKLRADGEIK